MIVASAVTNSLADPSQKDVVTAILGASAALGGFGLVFLGILISAYQGFPADTPKSVKDRRRRAVWPVLVVFALTIAEIALSLVWSRFPAASASTTWSCGLLPLSSQLSSEWRSTRQ